MMIPCYGVLSPADVFIVLFLVETYYSLLALSHHHPLAQAVGTHHGVLIRVAALNAELSPLFRAIISEIQSTQQLGRLPLINTTLPTCGQVSSCHRVGVRKVQDISCKAGSGWCSRASHCHGMAQCGTVHEVVKSNVEKVPDSISGAKHSIAIRAWGCAREVRLRHGTLPQARCGFGSCVM